MRRGCWIQFDKPSPRHQPEHPLSQARIGLLSTAGHIWQARPHPGLRAAARRSRRRRHRAHPFGLTLGASGDAATHELIARTVLGEAEREHPVGSIVSTPFRWNDDLRARQLRKQAH